MRIPLGFRFNPSDETLINGFLLPKVMGHPLPWNVIADTVVYGDNAAPWEVFSAADKYHWTSATTEAELKHSTYVFTTLTRASANRISRRAGCGTWGGETCKVIVDSTTGDVIGCKRMFKFKAAVAGSDSWIMHEYSLPGKPNDVVLCRITYSVSSPGKRPAGEEGGRSGGGGWKRHKSGHGSSPWTVGDIERMLDSEDVEEDCRVPADDMDRMLESWARAANGEEEGTSSCCNNQESLPSPSPLPEEEDCGVTGDDIDRMIEFINARAANGEEEGTSSCCNNQESLPSPSPLPEEEDCGVTGDDIDRMIEFINARAATGEEGTSSGFNNHESLPLPPDLVDLDDLEFIF